MFQAYCGVETVTLVEGRDTGHPRGFAFVEISNHKEAEGALTALDGTLLRERQLSVSEARPKHANPNGTAPTENEHPARGTTNPKTSPAPLLMQEMFQLVCSRTKRCI